MTKGIQLHISKPFDFGFDGVHVYAIHTADDGVRSYITFESAGDGQHSMMKLNKIPEPGQPVPPMLTMSDELFKKLAAAVTKYNTENDIKPEAQTFLEGKLLGTEKHLEDMRSLLFTREGVTKP